MIIRARLKQSNATAVIKVETFGRFIHGPRSFQLALELLGWTQWELVGYEADKPYTEIDLDDDNGKDGNS